MIARYFESLSVGALRDAMLVSMSKKIREEEACTAEHAALNEQANECAQVVGMIAQNAEADLDEARPVMAAIETALDSLDRNSHHPGCGLAELKLANPPDHIQLAMSAVLILLADGPEVPKDLSWAAAKKMTEDRDAFLVKLRDCGQALEVDEALVAAVEQTFLSDLLQIVAEKRRIAAERPARWGGYGHLPDDVGELLCTWAINVCTGAHIKRSVEPKRAELHNKQQKLDRLNRESDSLRARLEQMDALLVECVRAFDEVGAAESEPD